MKQMFGWDLMKLSAQVGDTVPIKFTVETLETDSKWDTLINHTHIKKQRVQKIWQN